MKRPRIVLTVGPTREPLDPVRYLSNSSSGEMGFALARELKKKAHVVVIAGPVALPPPPGITYVSVETALQMSAAVRKQLPRADAFIATAAVSDFRFSRVLKSKLKKSGRRKLRVTLVPNPDILAEAGAWKKKRRSPRPLLVGFALETKNIQAYAARKLREKNLDLIIGNTPASFGNKRISAHWIERGRAQTRPVRTTKRALAKKLAAWLKRKLS